MHYEAVPQKKEGLLSLSGELTLLKAAHLKEELLQALAAPDGLTLDIQALSAIDLACMQLLCAAYRSAVDRGRPFQVIPPSCEAIATTVAQAGLNWCHVCASAGENGCPWKGGK